MNSPAAQALRWFVLQPAAQPEAAFLQALRASGHEVRQDVDTAQVPRTGGAWDAVLVPQRTLERLGEDAFALLESQGVDWFPLPDAPGPELMAALARQVARRRKERERGAALDAELDELQLRLETVQEEMEDLHQRTAHELQGLLRHVEGTADTLERSAAPLLNASDRRRLQLLQASARQGRALIQAVASLAAARVARAERTPVDLHLLARECVAELSGENPGVEWSLGPLPVVMGDRPLLRLALRHLLHNAAKFGGVPHPAVEIRAVEEVGGLRVDVLDNGMGFDLADAARLFQPLERGHAVHEGAGEGVGLAIVRTVARRHEGRAGARLRPEGGAAFSLWLPQLLPEGAGTATQAAPGAGTILLADDDDLVLEALRVMLERDGYAVVCARSGDAALAALARADGIFEAVVSDWHMAGSDGLQVVRAAKRSGRVGRAILVTGRGGEAIEREALRAEGVDAVLRKPVRMRELREVLAGGGIRTDPA